MDNIKIHENINEKEQNPFETNINYMKYLFSPLNYLNPYGLPD